jgi:hypothetical protein
MNATVFSAVVASTLLGWATVSHAQTSYSSGESKRCNMMTGEQKAQCLRDEANKTQGAPADQAGAGDTRQPSAQGDTRSPHCDTMTGEQKEKCRDAEARKDENPATSKTGD